MVYTKGDLIESIETIKKSAGADLTSKLALFLDEAKKEISSERFSKAVKLINAFIQYGGGTNKKTIDKVKLLAKGLISRILKIEHERPAKQLEFSNKEGVISTELKTLYNMYGKQMLIN